MASTRFPGKPLASIMGIPMIGHVYFRSKMSKMLDELMGKANQLRLRKKNGWPIQLKEYQWLIRYVAERQLFSFINAIQKSRHAGSQALPHRDAGCRVL